MGDIGDILYSVITEIGKDKIQSDITSDIDLSKQYIDKILSGCYKMIDATDNESVGTLCEALLHFMLTACTLPSARKVSIDDIHLDIVIPNVHTLRNSPGKAIIIQIIKNAGGLTKEEQENLTKIQSNRGNLWIVSREPSLGNYINYHIKSENSTNASSRRFDDIITDIDKFLEHTKDRSFRFFH